MGQDYTVNDLSWELRSRIRKELLGPLEILELVPKTNRESIQLVEQVFKDFKKSSDRIWQEIHKKINNPHQNGGRR